MNELARDWYLPSDSALLEEIFPELTEESEDEKVRKEIMQLIQGMHDADPRKERWLAWLEKQKAVDILDEEEREFADNVDSYRKEVDAAYQKGYNEGVKATLEKQDTSKKDATREKVAEYLKNLILDQSQRGFPMLNYEGRIEEEVDFIINIAKKELKQDEQKYADKVKFKVGDWVVSPNGVYWHIDKISNNRYEVTSNTGESSNWPLDTNIYHKFTIQDAKDGDVLFQDLMGGKTFIYNGINPDMAILYSFIISNDGEDVLPYHIGEPNTGIGNIEENKNIIHPATKDQCNTLFAKMKEAGYEWDAEKKELKKIKHESIDKVESKFKTGEWVVTSYGKVNQVIAVDEDGDGFTLDDDTYFSGSWKDNYHLWTIADAKNGDVLAVEPIEGYPNPFIAIYKERGLDFFNSYCFIGFDGNFYKGDVGHSIENIHPATKEQQDALFAKMKEAGYEFDFEKKELKKIENETEIPFGAKDSKLQEATYFIPKGFHAEIDDDKVVIKKGEKPTAWSENDEYIIERLSYLLDNEQENYPQLSCDFQEIQEFKDWLKSLKQRIKL